MIRLLFVCTGNTCRSPLAEAIFKSKQLPNVEVKSAGTHAMDGDAASRNTLLVLKANQMELQHQSALVTDDLVDWATHIITMTEHHRSYLIHAFPHAKNKAFTLTGFTGSSGDISDPFGGPLELYETTFKQLNELLNVAAEKILDISMGEKDGKAKS